MSKSSALPVCFLALAFCLAVIFACASPMWAQSATTGALTGTITDPSNGVVVAAIITANNKATGQERTTTTDSSGVYKFSLLPPGEYSVKISAGGFKTAQVGSVTVNVTETAVLNQKLEIGAQTAEVTVEATIKDRVRAEDSIPNSSIRFRNHGIDPPASMPTSAGRGRQE
jgi:hypothetical protein